MVYPAFCDLEVVADHRQWCWPLDSIPFQYLIRSITKPEDKSVGIDIVAMPLQVASMAAQP